MRFLPWQHGVRTRTSSQWTTLNPVLRAGQHGYESDTGWYKIGDGTTAWNDNAVYYKPGGTTGDGDLELGATSTTAYRGDRGTTAYNHSQTSGNPHGATQDNVTDGATYKQYSQTEKTKLAGIETGADVTDAANVDAAGAVMNGDASTAGMSFVIDEDNMVSNSATKVPTQQSVKAYVDATGGGLTDSVRADIEIDNGGLDFLVVHPQLAAAKVVEKYLSTWASLGSANTDAAANPSVKYIVKVDETPSGLTNTTLASNLFLDYSNGFGLNVASGQVVTGNMPVNAPMHQIFTGLGQFRVRKSPGATTLYGCWYIPDGTGGSPVPITAAMSEAMRYFQFLNNGGEIILPNGDDYTINHEWLLEAGTTRGSQGSPNGVGTYIQQVTNGLAVFRGKPGSVGVKLMNLIASVDGLAGTESSVLLKIDWATEARYITGFFMDELTLIGGRSNVRLQSTDGTNSPFFGDITITSNCHLQDATYASFECNSINGSYKLYSENFNPAFNGTSYAVRCSKYGKLVAYGNANGVIAETLATTETEQFNFATTDVIHASDKVTFAGHGLSTNDSVYLTTTGTLPSGLSLNRKYWVRISGNDITFYDTPDESNVGSTPLAISSTGSGTHKLWSTRPKASITSSRPLGVFHLGESGVPAEIFDFQDEGIPEFIRVEGAYQDGVGLTENYRAPINLHGCASQGQVHFGTRGDVRVNLYGGTYMADSFKDTIGVTAKVRNYGAEFYTFGGLVRNRSGYDMTNVPEYGFADFKGSSFFMNEDAMNRGELAVRAANDVPIGGWEVKNRFTALKNWLKVKRMGSGALAGGFHFYNGLAGIIDAQVGALFDGFLAHSGRFLNSRTDAVNVATSAQARIDLSLGSYFTLTLDSNRALHFDNATAGYRQEVTLVILTSGTTSYDLTEGTNVFLRGTFATGTVSAEYFVLKFVCDGTRLVEVGNRSTGGGGGSVATDTIFDAKGDLPVGTAADTADNLTVGANGTILTADSAETTGLKWVDFLAALAIRGASSAISIFDRAANAVRLQLYSPVAGQFAIYSDLVTLNLLVMDDHQLVYTALAEAATGGAIRFNFDGLNGSFTEGLVINSTNGVAYFPVHLKLTNTAYGSSGHISVGNLNGLTFSSSNANPRYIFGGYAGTPGILTGPGKLVVPVTGNLALGAENSRVVYTNEGATSRQDFTLPAAAAGYDYEFIVLDTDGIRVIAASGDTIRIEATVSAAAGRIDSTVIGSTVRLICVNTTEWIAVSKLGIWTVT